jgi:threonyl-tRNA synthetase
VSKADAIKYFTEKGDEYKLELIEGLNDGEITFYSQGNFTDLCRGPHIPDTSFIKAAKVLSVAGAYWRGDEKRKQLTRLYAITFPKQKELDEYLVMLGRGQEARPPQAGQGTGPLHLQRAVGAGLPLWLPERACLARAVDQLHEDGPGGRRLRAGGHAAHRQQSTVCDQRPLGEVRQGQLPADQHALRRASSSC